MPQSVAVVQTRWPRAVYAVAVIALLAMPVQYRGGAALPHPHALFQLWTPGGHGLMHHDPHAGERALSMNASGEGNSGSRVVVAVADPGGPALTAMTTLAEKAAALTVVVATALLLLLDRPTVGGQLARRLVGFTSRPTDPPPRWVVSH